MFPSVLVGTSSFPTVGSEDPSCVAWDEGTGECMAMTTLAVKEGERELPTVVELVFRGLTG